MQDSNIQLFIDGTTSISNHTSDFRTNKVYEQSLLSANGGFSWFVSASTGVLHSKWDSWKSWMSCPEMSNPSWILIMFNLQLNCRSPVKPQTTVSQNKERTIISTSSSHSVFSRKYAIWKHNGDVPTERTAITFRIRGSSLKVVR